MGAVKARLTLYFKFLTSCNCYSARLVLYFILFNDLRYFYKKKHQEMEVARCYKLFTLFTLLALLTMHPMLSPLSLLPLLRLIRPLSLLTLFPLFPLFSPLSLLKHFNTECEYTVALMPTYVAPCLERSADLALWLYRLLSKNEDGVDWIALILLWVLEHLRC